MKKYLSRLLLPYEAAMHHRLTDAYQCHKWIWKAFPNDAEAERDFLFRFDIVDSNLRILVLSERQPAMIQSYSWDTTEISERFFEHKIFRFQVRANPVFRRKADGRRIALTKTMDLDNWFRRKLEEIGASILSLESGAPISMDSFKDGRKVRHGSVDARGVLQVHDVETFKEGFSRGIGAAKGFGFGLIMLQPTVI